jgi:hypothetical protein
MVLTPLKLVHHIFWWATHNKPGETNWTSPWHPMMSYTRQRGLVGSFTRSKLKQLPPLFGISSFPRNGPDLSGSLWLDHVSSFTLQLRALLAPSEFKSEKSIYMSVLFHVCSWDSLANPDSKWSITCPVLFRIQFNVNGSIVNNQHSLSKAIK